MVLLDRRSLLVVGVVLLTVLAGCSGAGLGSSGADGGDGAQAGGGDGGSGGGGLAGEVSGEDSAQWDGGDLPAIQQREVIFTGRVVLEVDDFGAARRNLTAATRARGGFVSDARAELHRVGEAERYLTGTVVLRVPRENFSVLMEAVEAGGTVVSSDTSSEDVTDQLVDVEARLSSLRTQRERLRELYRRANDTEEVLAVESRLSDVQTEIERLEARQQSLERQVAYSTITVQLREEPPEVSAERWYDVGVVAAFLESIDGVVVTLRALAVGLAYVLPYLVVFGAPMGAVAFVLRRRG